LLVHEIERALVVRYATTWAPAKAAGALGWLRKPFDPNGSQRWCNEELACVT
jgi:hypothetical protein